MSDRIPPELVTQILVRSQVETLLRCRSVCKQWRGIIDDPDFIKQHIKTNTNTTLFLQEFKGYEFEEDFDTLYHSRSVSNQTRENRTQIESIVGSCNGLLCKINIANDVILIHNPSTRKSCCFLIFLPREFVGMSEVGTGFGYDNVSGDYKIIKIVHDEFGPFESKILICNLRTKVVNGIPVPWQIQKKTGQNGVLVNGSLHWLVHIDDGVHVSNNVIMSFDLGTEKLGGLPWPEPDCRKHDSDSNFTMHIGVLETLLCLSVHHYEVGINVWVMKEYGVEESWTKLFMIPCDVLVFRYIAVIPLGFSKNGLEILLNLHGKRLVWYHIEEKRVTDVVIRGLEFQWFETTVFSRSLVPLDANVVGIDEEQAMDEKAEQKA